MENFHEITDNQTDTTMHKNISISLILLISLFSFSSCSTISNVSDSIGKALYNPVYEDRVVGQTVKQTINEATGEVMFTIKEPVTEKVIVRYEPNALGRLLETGADLIPIPGASSATAGILGLGSIALLAMERLRRKEKKGKVSAQDRFESLVGGIKDFAKTEEGAKVKDFLYEKVSDKAKAHGISKGFTTAVKVAKAIL